MNQPSERPQAQLSPVPEETSATDVRALTWVQDEVRRSLDASNKALQRHLREAEALRDSDLDRVDPAVLRAARTHLHQAGGALELVGLPVAARIVRAGEQAVQRCIEQPARLTPAVVQQFEAAWQALAELLSRLAVGRPASGVALFPHHRALLELAGAERIHPADLWEADWRWRTIVREPDVAPQGADGPTRDLMERLVLRLMRAPDRATLRRMSDLCAGLGADAKGRSATLWRLAAGFFEGQAQGLLRWDAYVKRTAPRLLAVVRGGLRPGEATDRLALDMLFFCARAIDPGEAMPLPRLRAVRKAYGLDRAVVPDYEDSGEGRVDPTLVAQARKRAQAAREAWSSVAGPEPARVPAIHETLSLLQDSIEQLFANGPLLAGALGRAAASVTATQPTPHAVAMEVATALLSVEAAIDDADWAHPAWAARLQRLAQRLDDALSGGDMQPLEPWMEEVYRRSSETQTLGTVVQELRGTLSEVERLLDHYCRDPVQRSLLQPVPGLLGHVRGVLSVLGLEAATAATEHMRLDLDQLAHAAATGPDAAGRHPQLLDRLADNLGALGFVVDILAVQPLLARLMFRFDADAGRLRALLPQRHREPGFGDSLAEPRGDEPSPEPPPAAQQPAVPLAPAPAAPPVAPSVGEGDALTAQVPAGASEPVPARSAVPAAPALALAAETAGDDGEDLLAVFLEESTEVITDARDALVAMADPSRDDTQDVTPMTAVRRAFHTLKGSSRMVGLSAYGEAAWACEQLYNARLAQAPRMDAPLSGLTGELLDYLSDWAAAVAARAERGHRAEPVVRSADAMRQQRLWVPLSPPAPPAAVEAALAPAAAEPLAASAVASPAPVPAPSVAAESPALPPPAEPRADEPPVEPPAPLEEPVKVVGPLRIEIAMFNIFLNEADELSRRLAMQLAEWSLDTVQAPPEEAVVLAHSLAGSSATVGYAELSTLSRALEHAMQRNRAAAAPTGEERQLFPDTSDDLRRMLHQFAAGFLVGARPGLLARLEAYQPPPGGDTVAEPFLERAPELPAEQPTVDVLPVQPDPAPADVPLLAVSDAVLPVPEPSIPERAVPEIPVSELSRERLAAAFAPTAPAVLRADDDVDLEDSVDSELLAVFAEEADVHLPQLRAQMRAWADAPQDRAASAACMRTLHTLKGAARLAGAMRVGELAHRLESTVEQFSAEPGLTAADVDGLLWRVDTLEAAYQALRDGVASSGTERMAGAAEPANRADPTAGVAPASADSAHAEGAVERLAPRALGLDWGPVLAAERAAGAAAPGLPAAQRNGSLAAAFSAVRVRSTLLDRLVNHAGETSIARTRLEADLAQVKSSLADLNDNLERLRRQLRDVEVQAEVQIISRLEAAKAASVEFDPLEMDRYTRMQELTRMMVESVDDVAAVQRSLQRALQSGEDQVALQGRLLRSMQDDLMRTRMVEFESLSDRLYRVVRQASRDSGKQVRLDIVGGSIEIDRGVLERMTAPFEHLLRNAIAHGIESPAARVAAGKHPAGQIRIHLAPEGNEVAIEFGDDGAGLDLPRIHQQAVASGLLTPEAPADDAQLAEFIFRPGFTTATQVTELAGRGVGMDVVRSEVQALGGRIQTETRSGQGTRFRMVLPLTTAVTQVLMVRCGELRVAVPSNLVEATRRETAQTVESAYRDGGFGLGADRVPFHWLAALLGDEPVGPASGRSVPVVVVRSAAQRVAVHVDEVLGTSEVVVKNLGPQLARLPGLAGITLLASGTIATIYNPVALAARYGAMARRRVEQLLAEQAPGVPLVVPRTAVEPAPLVLVVDDSLTVRRVTQRLLLREGYRVQTAKDGQEALERIAEERPRVVLSDIEMPRMDGFDLLRHLRAAPELTDLPVIMITSRIAQKHRDYARELGVRHYLGKPYGEEELLSVVARLARPEVSAA